MYKKCGCVSHDMPRLFVNITICSVAHNHCTDDIILAETGNAAECDCFPGCWDISYSPSVSVTPISKESSLTEEFGMHESEMTVLHVYFPQSDFRGYYKTAHIDLTEFVCELLYLYFCFACSSNFINIFLVFIDLLLLANIGGLLGECGLVFFFNILVFVRDIRLKIVVFRSFLGL